jgi:hypothetical protein
MHEKPSVATNSFPVSWIGLYGIPKKFTGGLFARQALKEGHGE